MKSRWLNLKSWLDRSREKTRYGEIERLIEAESDLNRKWIDKSLYYLSQNKADPNAENNLLTLIDTHTKKHKERGVFLVIFGALVAIIIKPLAPDWVLSIYLACAATLIASERIFTSNASTSLEELSCIFSQAKKQYKEQNKGS